MKKEFFHGTTRGIRIAFGGFVVALVGVVAGFLGFYLNEKWLSILGFVVVTVGVLIGFVGVVYGWIHDAKRAIKGSVRAANELPSKMRWPWKS